MKTVTIIGLTLSWCVSWTETNEVRYVYDGNLVIQERDTNNLPQVTYTRGTDLIGKLEGAGGIGGLLARTVNPSTINPQLSASATAFYHADGNGNITGLIYTNQTIAAKYEYDPYGNVLSKVGTLAEANVYRFSSKEYHQASGLTYYLYRYYDPNLQRWLNRDPLFELGAKTVLQKNIPRGLTEVSLFQFVGNDPLDRFDIDGLLDSGQCALATKTAVTVAAATAALPVEAVVISVAFVGGSVVVVYQTCTDPHPKFHPTPPWRPRPPRCPFVPPQETERCAKELDEVRPNGTRHCEFYCQKSGVRINKYDADCDTDYVTWRPLGPN